MWKLLNKLFGWDYALIHSYREDKVLRVRTLKNCDKYIIYFGKWVFLNEDGSTTSNIRPTSYRPLTWDLGEENE